MQTTLAKAATFAGIGLHTGRPAKCVVYPAPSDHGLVFHRMDCQSPDVMIRALWHNVRSTALNTRLGNEQGVEVSTVEHLMAALAGCGIHNARIEVHGPEVPALDGSSARFVHGLMAAGVVVLEAPLDAIEVTAPIMMYSGDAWARLEPFDGIEIDLTIEFEDAAIGRQTKRLEMGNGAFARELCDSRTFCCRSDIEKMREGGLALGGTYENAIVFDGAEVLNPGGLRHPDEAVRHKMLDVIGDLALAGRPILGRYVGHKSGHALTNGLLRTLMANPSTYRLRSCDAELAARLPGAGLLLSDIAAVA